MNNWIIEIVLGSEHSRRYLENYTNQAIITLNPQNAKTFYNKFTAEHYLEQNQNLNKYMPRTVPLEQAIRHA